MELACGRVVTAVASEGPVYDAPDPDGRTCRTGYELPPESFVRGRLTVSGRRSTSRGLGDAGERRVPAEARDGVREELQTRRAP